MAIVKISELPAANSPVNPSDVTAVVQDGVTKKASISQLGYLPPGLNAVTRTIQDRLEDSVSVKDFGAVGDGATDDTAAIQAAVTYVESSGAALHFPAGTYRITSTITNASRVRIVGDSHYRSILLWDSPAAGLMWDANQTVEAFNLIATTVAGTAGIPRTGDIAFDSFNILEFQNVEIRGFEDAVSYTGGFYYRFINTWFRNISGVCWKGGSGNNLNFIQCRFTEVGRCVEYTGGTGPINFIECDIEDVSNRIVSGGSGARAVVNFYGCYCEGLSGTGFFGIAQLNMHGNYFLLSNVTRLLNNTGVAMESIVSIGNTFGYDGNDVPIPGAEFIYLCASLQSGYFADWMRDFDNSGNPYNGVYFQGTLSNPDAVYGQNPITRNQISSATIAEQGTWTVQVRDQSVNIAPTTATGYYWRFGNQVTATFAIADIDTTGLNGAQAMAVTLPIRSSATQGPATGTIVLDNFTFPAGCTQAAIVMPLDSSTAVIRGIGSGIPDALFPVNSISSGVSDIVACTITYFV